MLVAVQIGGEGMYSVSGCTNKCQNLLDVFMLMKSAPVELTTLFCFGVHFKYVSMHPCRGSVHECVCVCTWVCMHECVCVCVCVNVRECVFV